MNFLTKLKRFFKKEEREIEQEIEKAVEIIKYEETKLTRYGYSLLKKILGPIIRKIWIHEVEGLENLPVDGPVIIASNHESYFDFLCFIAASPRKIHYLAAEKFFTNSIWRPIMNITGQIKVDRKSHNKSKTHQVVMSALEQGRMIGIFPEGTRSADGKMLKGFTGVAKFALKAKVPIVPVGLIGMYEIMSRYDKYPKFKKSAKIKIGKPLHFTEYHDKEHDEVIYRRVTDQVMVRIAELAGKEYLHVEETITEKEIVKIGDNKNGR